MSNWLDPVRLALDRITSPVTLFFRDDDAGWEDEKLFRLLDIVATYQTPIALAAIPMAIGPDLAAELRSILTTDTSLVSVHPHGYAHINHEASGRKSEFGASRPRDLQRQDLADGRRWLEDLLACALPPIFTPPWNRCTRETADCLAELGVRVLSRDVAAERFGLASLLELPVSHDWSGRRGVRRGSIAWGETIACAIAPGATVGIMLHHAVMTADDHRMLSDLLNILAGRSFITVQQMCDIAIPSHPPRGLHSCA
jgi:hypothetical protein